MDMHMDVNMHMHVDMEKRESPAEELMGETTNIIMTMKRKRFDCYLPLLFTPSSCAA